VLEAVAAVFPPILAVEIPSPEKVPLADEVITSRATGPVGAFPTFWANLAGEAKRAALARGPVFLLLCFALVRDAAGGDRGSWASYGVGAIGSDIVGSRIIVASRDAPLLCPARRLPRRWPPYDAAGRRRREYSSTSLAPHSLRPAQPSPPN